MPQNRATLPVGDIAFAALMVVFGMAIFIASLSLPPPVLEPVGPSAFPQWVSVIQIVLSLMILWRAFKGGNRAATTANYKKRFDLAIAALVLMIAYFGVLQLEWLSFRWATAAFVFLLTAFLFDWKPGKLPIAAGLAVVLGLGLKYTFTEILYLDLP